MILTTLCRAFNLINLAYLYLILEVAFEAFFTIVMATVKVHYLLDVNIVIANIAEESLGVLINQFYIELPWSINFVS